MVPLMFIGVKLFNRIVLLCVLSYFSILTDMNKFDSDSIFILTNIKQYEQIAFNDFNL